MFINIIAGENFSEGTAPNTNLVVTNRKAVEYLKFNTLQDAVGQDILIYDTLPVIIIGILTIVSQTIKAANSNLVDILKYE